jgi:putative ABC transport system permease protein
VIPDRLPLARRLRRVFWPVPVEREIAEELSAHIELQTRRYMDAGMSEDDARAAARLRFGDMERVRSECRDIRDHMETDMRRAELRQEVRMDVEFALRALRRNPLFSTVAVFTIALAIGANTAIFSVLNAVLLRSLPYRHAERAAMVWNSNSRATVNHTAIAVPEYFDLKEQLRAHDAVAAITRQPSALVGEGGEPERVNAYVVTPNMFELVGATPALGRGFGGDDGTPGAARVIVLSHALWTRRFGGDPTVIGRTVSVAGFVRTIVGVMPSGVRFPDAPLGFLREPADLWIPSTWQASRGDSRGNQIIGVVVRRAPGVTDAQADADLDAVAARWRVAYPERYATENAKQWSLAGIPLHQQMVGNVRKGLLVIAAAVGLVLLIACVNVANLLLARGAARRKELAIRVALGAGRARLVRQLLTESVVLATAGGAIGVFLAWAGIRLLVRLDAGQLPRLSDTHLDSVVLLYTLGLSVATGLLVGLVPAFQQSADGNRAGGGLNVKAIGGGDAPGRHRMRVSLVVAQVAMALVVLVAAGLLGRSFLALERVKPGFSADGVMSMQITLPRTKYDSSFKVTSFYGQLVASVSGATHVSGGYPLPMSGDGWSGSYTVEGEPFGPNDPIPHAEYGVAMPGFFQTLRIPLITGREFAATDTPESPDVVIVDEALAKRHWQGGPQNAIGKHVNQNRRTGQWSTVIGVVGHVYRAGPQTEGEPQIYLPHAQSPQATLSIVARGRGEAVALTQPMRAAVRALDAELPVSKVLPMGEMVSAALAKQRFDALLLGIFGLTALMLASVGLYGVMAYLVSQRTREIGIRMALGGEAKTIRRLVLREGMLISALGLAAGTAVSLAGSKAVSGLLFGVAPTDALTYSVIAGLLLLVGALASYGPARRATRIDPLAALRE